ncbi:MAG: methyltransferase domain-containing protein [Phycisphaeraceae bacterium]|nr:methyltransferase domain-containing protein [Phycisphaeraceae bacterium]
MTTRSQYSTVVETARAYYNSDDADNFYYHVWGGEDIHIGLYQSADESIAAASRRTVERMAGKLPELKPGMRVIDLGGGYGGAMRYLAHEVGCSSVVLNISEKENERDREMNRQQKVDHLIEVRDGDFADMPYPDASFDAAWSQDAILHADDRRSVVNEVARLLKPGGRFVFTDPMQTDDAPTEKLQPIYDRIHLESLASPGFYRRAAEEAGLVAEEFEEHAEMLPTHYARVLAELEARGDDLIAKRTCGEEYIQRMKKGLQHWVDGGRQGHLTWGIFVVRKPA